MRLYLDTFFNTVVRTHLVVIREAVNSQDLYQLYYLPI